MLSHLLSSLSSFSLSRRSIFPISLTLVLTSYLLHRYRHIRTAKHPTLQPCISSSLGIYTTRTLYYMIPISIQHKIRDSGLFAHISDKGAIIGGFFTLLLHPHLITDLITHHDRIYHIAYGEYDRCILDVYHHTSSTSTSPSTSTSTRLRPIIIFIHGGAWGSGNKLMYRLYAYAMAKYTQLADISAAISWCHLHATSWGGDIHNIYLMGHSSGAHLAVLNVVERAMKGQHAMCAGVIGLAGVYDIIAHYDFEAMRGVHEISPMKPAAGGSRDSICISAHDDTQMIQAFTTCSPTLLVPTLSPAMRALLPPICLIHGELDTTVPITSSQHLLHQLHQSSPHPHLDRLISCSHADHASLILDVMLQTGEMWRDHILAITSFISDVRDANQRTHHDTFNEMHHRIQQQLHIPAAL